MESKVTIGEGKAAFPPGGAEAARRAEGTCRGRFLSFPVPPSWPAPPTPTRGRPRQQTARLSAASCSGSLRGSARVYAVPAPVEFKRTRGEAPALPRQPVRLVR